MEKLAYILPLDAHDATLARVGGKGASLSRLAQAGFPVPPGFHVTTEAYRHFVAAAGLQSEITRLSAVRVDDAAALEAASTAIRALLLAAPIPDDVAAAIRAAYTNLSSVPPGGFALVGRQSSVVAVAVRSSATAEDLPDASFAGQQDTFLNMRGEEQVLDAVRRCWASLWTARAMGYRARNEIDHAGVSLAVVVQQLIPADAAGILFTANPLTGHRGQVVIDAAWGLGEAVVGGQVTPDEWTVDKVTGQVVAAHIREKTVLTVRTDDGTEEVPLMDERRTQPVLTEARVTELTGLSVRIESYYGAPQDIEWAITDGQVYILQSRPITSLYPQPSPLPEDGQLHVYMNAGYLQGVVEPWTPAGQAFFRQMARGTRLLGFNPASEDGPSVFNIAGERVFIDITTPTRSPRASKGLGFIFGFIDPQMGRAWDRLRADPRLAPQPDRPLADFLRRFAFLRFLPKLTLPRVVRLWINPDQTRARQLVEHHLTLAALHQRIQAAQTLQDRLDVFEQLPRTFGQRMLRLVALVVSGISLQQLSSRLIKRWLNDEKTPLEMLRGIPHNPTTTMDLTLWAVSRHIAADPLAAAALRAPTAEVVERYKTRTLPPTLHAGLGTFLAAYGHRAVREIDIGVPRWSEEPGYIVDVLRTYLDITDPALAPDVHFRHGAEAAAAAQDRVLARLGPVRQAILRFMLNRMRALVGLREAPKFFLVRILAEVRALWWAMGRDLVARGALDDAGDVFFVTADEIRAVVSGKQVDLKAQAAQHKRAYHAELRRRRVPRLLTNDGVELYGETSGATSESGLVFQGTSASAGVAEGVVRVVLDPHGASLQPGEILVAPSTDPAWTPLFLAAGGLVMEAGGLMSHGSVVAREYGIPAVVGVHEATHMLKTGQRVVVDGNTGQVRLVS